jgi:hypothetical protein
MKYFTNCIIRSGLIGWPILALSVTSAAAQLNSPTFSTTGTTTFTLPTDAHLHIGQPLDIVGDKSDEIALDFFYFPLRNKALPLRLLLKNGDKQYVEARKNVLPKPPQFVHPRDFVVARVDKDKKDDLYIVGHGYDAEPFRGEPNALLLSNQGKLTTRPLPANKPSFTHSATAGDINNDGLIDFYDGNISGGAISPRFLLGQKDGRYVATTNGLPSDIVNRTKRYLSAILVDIDNDGDLDLVLGGDASDASPNTVLLNDGTGDFTAQSIALPAGLFGPLETNTMDILAIDINTDGYIDLVMSQTDFDPFYQGAAFQVLVNVRGQKFIDRSKLLGQKSAGPRSDWEWRTKIRLADFYGDGLSDIVASNGNFASNSDQPLLWINDGGGKFAPKQGRFFDNQSAARFVTHLFPIKANSDRRTDILTLRRTLGTEYSVDVYYNGGVGKGGRVRPPKIVRQLKAVSVNVGGNAILSVSARGNRPLRFKWKKNGAILKGKSGPVLQIRKASASDAGKYHVTVINADGAVRSKTAVLQVN